jgi:pimeloyl-ACP methyl ester carboxylesterase
VQLDPRIRHETVQANGLRFHVATCGQGDRLALLLHGFPECWFSWRDQLPLFADLGYRAWAPDLRGYGESSRPLGIEPYAIERLMDDVGALIDASGARSTVLVAHDWGAIVAWFFAMRRVRPLERLVIMNVPHLGAVEARGFNPRQLVRSWYVLFFQIPRLPEWLLSRRNYHAVGEAFRSMAIDKSRFPDEVLAVFRENVLQPGAITAMLNWYRAAGRHFGALGAQGGAPYPVIETPTLLIWGEEDTALGKETSFGTERFVKDLTVRYLPRVSHWVQQEAPEAVNEILERWLEEHH